MLKESFSQLNYITQDLHRVTELLKNKQQLDVLIDKLGVSLLYLQTDTGQFTKDILILEKDTKILFCRGFVKCRVLKKSGTGKESG